MIIFERNITPRIGKGQQLVSSLQQHLPAYRELLGLPVTAYQTIGSGPAGGVKLVIVGDSVAALAAAAERETPELRQLTEATRAETNAVEDEQMKMVIAHHPPASEDEATYAYGAIGVGRTECLTDAAENAVAVADHMMSLGARSTFTAWSITGRYGELTTVATFATAAEFDAWTAAWLANPRSRELVAQGAAYTHSGALYRSELYRRIA